MCPYPLLPIKSNFVKVSCKSKYLSNLCAYNVHIYKLLTLGLGQCMYVVPVTSPL